MFIKPATVPKASLKASLICGVLLAFVTSTPVIALDSCIEKPRRTSPCPHQIYKMMKLKEDQPAQITCICLADFSKFQTPAKGDKAIALRKMELKQLAAELQLTEAQIIDMAKR
ncbi:MAG: hypothetical protein ACI8WB_005751 [Phenylobacterium sp.]|jgi:hypothetical protein